MCTASIVQYAYNGPISQQRYIVYKKCSLQSVILIFSKVTVHLISLMLLHNLYFFLILTFSINYIAVNLIRQMGQRLYIL